MLSKSDGSDDLEHMPGMCPKVCRLGVEYLMSENGVPMISMGLGIRIRCSFYVELSRLRVCDP